MWKKDDAEPAPTTHQTVTRAEAPRATGSQGRATIGPSISIRGDVTGSEDLLIQGQVDGSVTLDLHAISVGSEGRVKANITGRVITIEGTVEGDLVAKEQIILRGSAKVQGDIRAPRVVLEDGATFRGLVDMGDARGGEQPAKREAVAVAPRVAAPAATGVPQGSAPGAAGTGKQAPGTAGRAMA